MKLLEDYKYSKDHEWLKTVDNGYAIAGVTDYAQEQMGDIVYVELPETDKEVEKGEIVAVINSPKSASDVFSPISGKIVETNEKLDAEPELINSDPYGEGWLWKMKINDEADLNELLNSEGYKKFVETNTEE